MSEAYSYNQDSFSKEHIGQAITERRDQLLSETKGKGIAHLAYYHDADSASYQVLNTFARTAQAPEYEAAKMQLDESTKFNLITHLGERYNVGLSTYRYEIKDGVFYPQDGSEPLLKMLIRGRDFRKQNGSSLYDQKREAAEVVGMLKTQTILTNPNAQVGLSVISNSPSGEVLEDADEAEDKTIYKHNFYDVFTLKEKNGKKFVESRRYSSALTRNKAAQKFSEIDERYSSSDAPTDDFFLSNPVVISPEKTADDIHAWLHKEHDFMTQEEFEKEILTPCMPILLFYIDALSKNPYDLETRNLAYNALLVKADESADKIRARKAGIGNISWIDDYRDFSHLPIDEQIAYLGTQEAKQIDTGCGFSGSVEVSGLFGSSISPFSVMEFGALSDKYGSRKFPCPATGCGKENIRPLNQLLTKCQHCGSTEVACKPGDEKKDQIVAIDDFRKSEDLKEGREYKIAA